MVSDVYARAVAFLAGDGLAYARSQLRRHRLPADLADDVLGEVNLALVRAVEGGTEIENLEAFLTATTRRRVIDVLRGRLRRPEVLARGGEDDVDPLDVAESDDPGPDVEIIGRAVTADVRANVVRHLARDGLAAAGALAVLAHLDPDTPATPADDCPQPTAGASPSEAVAWVGLFYAGRRGWEGADAATRKRRSRWARAQTGVLEEAAAELGLQPGGDRG